MMAWLFLIVMLVGGLLFVGYSFKNSIRDYEILEVDIKESTNAYIKMKEIDLANGESMRISTNELLESTLLKSTKVGDDTCKGYALVYKNNKKIEIEAKIKCSEYASLEYSEE